MTLKADANGGADSISRGTNILAYVPIPTETHPSQDLPEEEKNEQ